MEENEVQEEVQEEVYKDFKIIITGSAVYEKDSMPVDFEKNVITFQQVANFYFRKHRKELAKMFEDLAPLEGNSAYTKSFSIREVDVEA